MFNCKMWKWEMWAFPSRQCLRNGKSHDQLKHWTLVLLVYLDRKFISDWGLEDNIPATTTIVRTSPNFFSRHTLFLCDLKRFRDGSGAKSCKIINTVEQIHKKNQKNSEDGIISDNPVSIIARFSLPNQVTLSCLHISISTKEDRKQCHRRTK